MKNLILTAAIAALAACGGPSGRDVAMAKQARFQGDKLELFATAKAATEAKYKLAKSDETTLGLQTTGRWYSPEGLGNSNSDTNLQDLVDQSINLTLVVELLPEGSDKWIVSVRPVMFRFTQGQPKPHQLDAKDPSVPGWVHGKVDQLHFAIYEKLKPYEVKTPGGIAPAPEPTAPTPMPDEGGQPPAETTPPPPAAEGSAAPAPAAP
jgi:hypothetical protein